ncbi:fructosamine kinase family protein [Salinithrix halophila]|uniref:Fructosamine kinase family protein n=1 Tax=Salinithrix halophila TaxID=1485204 RepID=A0ABV8JII0_9BACL
MLSGTLKRMVEETIGSPVLHPHPVSGGEISDAFRLETEEGRYFLKVRKKAPAGLFAVEAAGLTKLDVSDQIRIPRVIAHGITEEDKTGWILLEWLESDPQTPSPQAAEDLGRGLAEIHRTTAPSFGLEHDNFIGTLPQKNGYLEEWTTFYRERRLRPQIERARRQNRLPSARERGLTRLMDRLDEWIGYPEIQPSLLHGDLWGGNWIIDKEGVPCLIDPATYYGHREVDLAFTQLFGGFPAAFYDAYQEAWPLDPGFEDRKPLYQLFYLLVHLNIFGESYGNGVDQVWKRFAGE